MKLPLPTTPTEPLLVMFSTPLPAPPTTRLRGDHFEFAPVTLTVPLIPVGSPIVAAEKLPLTIPPAEMSIRPVLPTPISRNDPMFHVAPAPLINAVPTLSE